MKPRVFATAGLLACLWTGPAGTQARIDPAEALARSEAAIGRAVGDHRLVRPLVVSLVYTSCSSVCPLATETLKSSVAQARSMLGESAFEVLTVGFDARSDTPSRMAAFAADHDISGDPFWHVATASPAVLRGLLGEVGFTYSGAAGGFEHVAQTTILDADGRVYRQIYGDEYPLQVLVEPLKELVFGVTTSSFTPAALADRLRFLCTVYDPKTGRYRVDYTLFLEVGAGGLSLALMAWMILRMWRGSRRHA
jgi:protein SCO1/2